MTAFYFVRHAHANWQPDENRPLSESGLSKAQRVAEILDSYPIDQIYTSPYRRASQTVEPLAERLNLPIQSLHGLRESQLIGGPFETVDDFDRGIKAVWRDPNFSHPGGESNAEARQRSAVLIEKLMIQHSNDHVVLGTHGNLMALTLQHFEPTIDFNFWKSLSMPDIYRLTVGQDIALKRLWSDTETS